MNDAEIVYKFFTKHLKIDESNMIISGRSIGSGPSCHLAAKYNPCCVFLISPIKSVLSIARKLCGNLVDLIVEERFDNMKVSNQIRCPVALIHGLDD